MSACGSVRFRSAHLLRRPATVPQTSARFCNVLHGRRVTPERVEEVAHHYELFGGVSPITELTQKQAEGLRATSGRRGPSAARLRRHAQLASAAGRHAARDVRRRRPAGGRVHRRGAPLLLELPAVPRERRRRARGAAPGDRRRHRRHLRRAAGSIIRCSSQANAAHVQRGAVAAAG